MSDNQKILSREVEASLIPQGDTVTLPEGTEVTITHRLGGNFTVTTNHGMFRIAGKFADALGEEVADTPIDNGGSHEGPPSEDAIWDNLKKVFDPEIPVNIVDLGLIYTMKVNEEDGNFKVHIDLTLTAPGCGMGPVIAEDAKHKVLEVPGVSDAHVEIVWDPPWQQDMMSEEGKMELGLI